MTVYVCTLTIFPSDMLFGVGLGCLLQMIRTKSNVEVIFSHTQKIMNLCRQTHNLKLFWNPWTWRIFVSFSSSVWTRGTANMGSCRISGFVFGSVLCHCSFVPVPLGSELRDLSPHLLCHLPRRCNAHRVWHNPLCVTWHWLTSCHIWRMAHWKKNCTVRRWIISSAHQVNALFLKESPVYNTLSQSHAVVGSLNQTGKWMPN